MALTLVNSCVVRPACVPQFEGCVQQLAEKAVSKQESWRWTAHQTLFGDVRRYHFVYQTEGFAALDEQGTVADLWKRVMGPKRGEELFAETNACIDLVEHTISTDRLDLSYPPDDVSPGAHDYAVVTTAQVRPGHAEACEELIRKVAEAIPKADDPSRLLAFQSLVGDLRIYWTVRPLRRLEDLDRQLPTPDLLNRAFGIAEGGLIWRAGNEAIQQVQREIVTTRRELSNLPS